MYEFSNIVCKAYLFNRKEIVERNNEFSKELVMNMNRFWKPC